MDSIQVVVDVKKNGSPIDEDRIKTPDDGKSLPLNPGDTLEFIPDSPAEVDSITVKGDNIKTIIVTVYDEDGNPSTVSWFQTYFGV